MDATNKILNGYYKQFLDTFEDCVVDSLELDKKDLKDIPIEELLKLQFKLEFSLKTLKTLIYAKELIDDQIICHGDDDEQNKSCNKKICQCKIC